MLVLASLLVPSLTLVCVVVYFICEVIKICGWKWFRDSTFILGSVRVLLFTEALGTSSSLAVEGEAVQVSF